MRPAAFQPRARRSPGEPAEALVNEVVLRAQSQAEYTHENYGHFGLNLRRYAHFTSPIRRYADLSSSRADPRAELGRGRARRDGRRAGWRRRRAHLGRRAARHGGRARDHGPADRRASAEQIGARFRARIAGVTRSDCTSSCATPAPTASSRPAASAPIFPLRGGERALVGTRTGETFRLGDSVEVKLLEAAPFAGALRFEMLSRRRRARAARKRGVPPMSETKFEADACAAPAGLAIRRGLRAAARLRQRPAVPRLSQGGGACAVCGEDLITQRADDAPAYLTMLIVGHSVVAGLLAPEFLGRDRRPGRHAARGGHSALVCPSVCCRASRAR